MIRKIHNEETKKFFQKLLLFIDTTINQAVASESTEAQKITTTGLLNIKDAVFSEIIRDNHANYLNEALEDDKKKKEKDTTNQEQASEKDQSV